MKRMKVGGYVLLETVLAMIAFSMLSMAFFTIFSGQFSMINSSRDAMQAQQYAEIDAQKLRLMNYYDLEDEGAKSRSAMTSWSNPGDVWEDEITIGNEIIIDDYTESKQRIATIKIYRQGDTLARFSMEVPISSQNSGGGVPIGGIVAWGVEGNPQYDGGTYLECDGNTFDTNKFKRLYEVLGTNKLPNYQGMFLRGAGEQSYAQVNGKIFDSNDTSRLTWGAETSTSYSSGNVGEIQGDAIRNATWRSPLYFLSVDTVKKDADTSRKTYQDEVSDWYIWKVDGYEATGPGIATSLMDSNSFYKWDGLGYTFSDFIFAGKPFHYRYDINYDTFTTEEGTIRYVSSIEEKEEPLRADEGYWNTFYRGASNGALGVGIPTDNEIRPVNVAVKFMIKAK